MTEVLCPLCGTGTAEVVFERKTVPVHQNILCETADEARSFARADVTLAFCGECSFTFNRAFDPLKLSYSGFYDNSQAHSPAFQRYLAKLRDYLQVKYGLRGKEVIEVGCGKGDFLRLMCAGGMNRGLGFDPTYEGPETAEQGAVRFVKAFYGGSHGDGAADFLCSRHVLEHIQCPNTVLRAMRESLGDHTDSVIYIEVPDLTWTLDQAALWDIFYEHCSYFTPGTLARSCQTAGFEIERIFSEFGGQYLGLEARPASARPVSVKPAATELADLRMRLRCFRKSGEARIQTCRDRIRALHGRGGCALWGAAAKGTTLANMIDPDGIYIRCLIDINPSKRGKFVAGSGHRIIAPEDIRDCVRDLGCILSMNSNYLEEQRAKLAQLSLDITLMSL